MAWLRRLGWNSRAKHRGNRARPLVPWNDRSAPTAEMNQKDYSPFSYLRRERERNTNALQIETFLYTFSRSVNKCSALCLQESLSLVLSLWPPWNISILYGFLRFPSLFRLPDFKLIRNESRTTHTHVRYTHAASEPTCQAQGKHTHTHVCTRQGRVQTDGHETFMFSIARKNNDVVKWQLKRAISSGRTEDGTQWLHSESSKNKRGHRSNWAAFGSPVRHNERKENTSDK